MSRSLRWLGSLGLVVVATAAVWLGWFARRSPISGAEAIGPLLDEPELVLQTGHSHSVAALAFSPDGRRLASAGSNDPIKIWDVATGRELRSLAGHTGNVQTLAFSSDGTELASGTEQGTELTIWNVSTGEAAFANPRVEFAGGISSVSFAPEGRALFFGGAAAVELDLTTGEVKEPLANSASLDAVVMSPDWRFVAAARSSPAGAALDIVDRSSARVEFTGPTTRQRLLAFSADGRFLASAGFESSVTVRDAPSGRETLTVRVHGLARAIAISPRGRWLVVGTDADPSDSDATGVRVWDLASGREVRPFAALPAVDRGGVYSLAFGPDDRTLAIGLLRGTILLSDLDAPSEPRRFDGLAVPVDHLAPSADGRWLATAGSTSIDLWSLDAGTRARTLSVPGAILDGLALSADGAWIAVATSDGGVWLAEPIAGTRWAALGRHAGKVVRTVFSHDGARLASAGADGELRIWSVSQRRQIATLSGLTREPTQIGFSPNDRLLMAVAGNELGVWDARSGARQPIAQQYDGATEVAFSADWRRMAWVTLLGAGPQARLTIADFGTGQTRGVEFSGDMPWRLAFSRDGDYLAGFLQYHRRIAVWDSGTGVEMRSFETQGAVISDLAFPDAFRLITAGWDGSTRVWNPLAGRLRASLVSLRHDAPVPGTTRITRSTGWAVVSPDGFFDGSPDAWSQIRWRFRADLVSLAPVEAFFNDFYVPGLLADVARGGVQPPPRDLRQIDRRQPRVNVTAADPGVATSTGAATRTVDIRIDVTEAPADSDHPQGAGARDLRVFRNGSLVHTVRGNLLADGRTRATRLVSVPVVAGENRIVAYAFNHDNVKSADAMLVLTGGEALRRVGATRILAIGIDQYENADYNLRYAVADATAVATALAAARRRIDPTANVDVVTLTNRDATRANILRALKRLAGAESEDSIIIYYAGHGTAARSRFYLIPHDLGYRGRRDRLDQEALATILSHGLSDQDLEVALEPIVAERIVLIIDACNSGQALDAEEKRRGPMNSRGLAQLAYEKGMHILTAAQGYQAALEAAQLGHGYLTYALVEEGLTTAAADHQPADGQVAVREWFDYAVERVPVMQRARLVQSRLLKHEVVFVEGDEQEDDVAKRRVQQPRVFYRRELEREPYVIARSKGG